MINVPTMEFASAFSAIEFEERLMLIRAELASYQTNCKSLLLAKLLKHATTIFPLLWTAAQYAATYKVAKSVPPPSVGAKA